MQWRWKNISTAKQQISKQVLKICGLNGGAETVLPDEKNHKTMTLGRITHEINSMMRVT
jgi:hypothetical protein